MKVIFEILKILIILCVCNGYSCQSQKFRSKVSKLVQKVGDLKNQLEFGKSLPISDNLKKILSKIPLETYRDEPLNRDELELACTMCLNAAQEFLKLRREQRKDVAYFKNLLVEFCVELDVQTEEVCERYLDQNLPVVLFIVDNKPDIDKDDICGLVLQEAKCEELVIEIETDIEFRELDEPEYVKIDATNSSISETIEDLNIIHLTDIHLDFKYMEKGKTECPEPSCCRVKNDLNPVLGAGYWGDYRDCDSPLYAIENALEHIKEQHPKIDMIYFTGDIVSHAIFESSIETNVNTTETMNQLLRDTFGENIPVYSILGNHEAHPVNLFAPQNISDTIEEFSTNWLYESSIEQWQFWLPNSTFNTIQKGGYYTTLIRPGLRLIALNNNYCYIYNWWLLYDLTPAKKQFQWLQKTLSKAKEAGEKVHILAHIPNGHPEFYEFCSKKYFKIVNKFHQIIAGQFNGHTEYWSFNLFFSKKRSYKPIGVAFNGGGLSTYSQTNRNYVLYKVDPFTFEVKNLESWTYNLTNTSKSQKPKWYKQFSLKEAFDLEDLSPHNLKLMAQNLARNQDKLLQFWQYKISDSDLLLGEGCDTNCMKENLCEIMTSKVFQEKHCKKLLKIYNENFGFRGDSSYL